MPDPLKLIAKAPAWAWLAAAGGVLWFAWPVLRTGAAAVGTARNVVSAGGGIVQGALDRIDLGLNILTDPVRTLGGEVPGTGNDLSRWVDRNIVTHLPEAREGATLGTWIYDITHPGQP